MRIMLVGGGTGGSVSPLLAIATEIKKQKPEAEFLFCGTKKGIPEKHLCEMHAIPFKAIFSGKLRRYISIKNIIDIFFIFCGFIQSFFIIIKFKPNAIVSSGSFVAVPPSFAGWLLHIPIFSHQQDIVPGLANKILAPFAKKITVSFEKSLHDFNTHKTILTGNPVRARILSGNRERALEIFNLEENLPTILIIGGGTGAAKINTLILHIVPSLTQFCQIIHITGNKIDTGVYTSDRYHQYEFLKNEISHAYAISDVVISRAGMGVLNELAALGKPTIIIPIPHSHQEYNASYFNEHKAAMVCDQNTLTFQKLLDMIHLLIASDKKRALYSLHISKLGNSNAAKNITEIILKNISL